MILKKLLNNQSINKALIIITPMLWMSLLILAPMLIVFSISFSEYSTTIPPYKLFFGFNPQSNDFFFSPLIENYQIFFEDSIYIKSILNSLRFALITTLCTLAIGYPIALGISNSSENSKNLLLTLMILPFWTSLIIRVYAWKTILGYDGIINNVLINYGLITERFIFLNTESAVILGLVYCYLPFMIFPLFIAIERIDRSLTEAAQDLGYSPIKSFFKITLPLSKPGIIAGCMLVFVPVIGEYVIPDLLGGAKIINIGKIIWIEFFQNKDWPIASAITIILVVTFIIPLIVIQKFINENQEEDN